MSRRPPPSDAFTRFTSTSPTASAQPSSTPSFISQPTFSPKAAFNIPSDPDGETPAQKVARLRTAARAQKEASLLSPADRVIARGRIWADFAHRFVTYGLIGFTGVAFVISLYSVTSLVSHNRRQKRAWIDTQMQKLDDARASFLRGDASAEQLHLLEQERAGEAIKKDWDVKQRKKKEEGIWGRVKGTFGVFSRGGEMGSEQQKRPERLLEEGWVEGTVDPQQRRGENVPEGMRLAAVGDSGIRGVGIDEKGRPVPVGKMVRDPSSSTWSEAVERERRTGEREVVARTGFTKGPLDQLADNAIQSVGGDLGWLSWMRDGKS